MHENFKHTYEYSPARMRLGLRVSPLIGNIQVCVLPYVLQLCPSISLRLRPCTPNYALETHPDPRV